MVRTALSEVHAHFWDASWWRDRFLSHVVGRYYRRFRQPDSIPLPDLDWDNLIILDACRYDLFAEVWTEFDLSGTLSTRRSLASVTPGFLRENFAGGEHHDTVYVTANPYVTTELPAETFHAVDAVWRDGWDDNLQTVTPSTMTDRTLAALDRNPDKRLISHFIQPHEPFIGEPSLEYRDKWVIRESQLGNDHPDRSDRTPSAFERLRDDDLNHSTVWAAYRSNLERALPHVARLLEALDGKTVVTADHGNAFGSFARPFPVRLYGHPPGIFIRPLTEVPYLEHTAGPRREITTEAPEATATDDQADVADRLKALGYLPDQD